MNKNFLITACILAAVSVALGAFGAHKLKELVSPELVQSFDTGVRYQFYHVFALFITAILYGKYRQNGFKTVFYLFIAGIICFSGSIYLLTFLKASDAVGLRGLGLITPVGGVLFIIAWLYMAVLIYKARENNLIAM